MPDTPRIAPPRPALALPPRPALRRGLWALPLLLSLVFVAAILVWLRDTEQSALEDQRAELISDALTLQSQVTTRLEHEASLLQALADHLARQGVDPATLASAPDVAQGLHRFWSNLTWLDGRNRILASVPPTAPGDSGFTGPGLSAHLSSRMEGGGSLVARYSPGEMLRQTVPWWLARKYDVRLVDSYGSVLAATAEHASPSDAQSHSISLEPTLADAYLELTARDLVPPWYRGLPVWMVSGFVVLIAGITWMLRRQMLDVSRAEAAWRTEAAWRNAMEDSLTIGLRARTMDGQVLFVNRAFSDMVGFAPEDLTGLRPPMPYWPPDAIDAAMVNHRRNMAGGAPRGGYETRWRHRDGHALEVIVFEAPLVDAGGQQIGWMGSFIDITERKRLEERERHHTEAMAHHARLTMLGEIASTLAHELNQPLSAISSYNAGVMNSLQREARSTPDDPVLRALQRLGEQAAHAGRIVQRIRAFLTRREPQLEPCSLNAVVDGALALLRRDLARQQVQIEWHPDPTTPDVLADAVLIEQVVINLLRNAADALTEQASTTARVRRIVLRSTNMADRGLVSLEVRDNGPGLMGRRIEDLCAPFYSTKSDGMGMGLAICRSLLEAHHGSLDATEAPEGGAQFTFCLPAHAPATLRR